MFNKYYQDEFLYLRDMGREFAQVYPALAPMLAERGADPDVERLLEGMAYMTGRIRQKLDSEIPEAIVSLASLLFPHFTRSIPSCTILELTPQKSVEGPIPVPSGTEFGSIKVDGTSCLFRSTWDTTVYPWQVEGVRLETTPYGRQELKVDIRSIDDRPLSSFAPDRLRIHFSGESRESLGLLAWVRGQVEEIGLMAVDEENGKEIRLGKSAIEPIGYLEDEGLLPFGAQAFPGFRLIEEYFVLPAKFAFVDIVGIRRVLELGPNMSRFTLVFRSDVPLKSMSRVTPTHVRLHCLPVINLFRTTAEPMRLKVERSDFILRPAGLPPEHAEVYLVERVETLDRATRTRFDIPGFYDFADAPGGTNAFYNLHIGPSITGAGIDTTISFGTPEDKGVIPEVDIISVDLLATNRNLASALRPGEISVPTITTPKGIKFSNISAVTAMIPPPAGPELHWRVVSHIASGMRSLTEPEVLRSMMGAYNLFGPVDRQAARSVELRAMSVKDIRIVSAIESYHGSPVRGVNIEVDLDEDAFSGDGDLFLFSSILDRLYAEYVSINAFSRLVVRGVKSRVEHPWPARSGDTIIS